MRNVQVYNIVRTTPSVLTSTNRKGSSFLNDVLHVHRLSWDYVMEKLDDVRSSVSTRVALQRSVTYSHHRHDPGSVKTFYIWKRCPVETWSRRVIKLSFCTSTQYRIPRSVSQGRGWVRVQYHERYLHHVGLDFRKDG